MGICQQREDHLGSAGMGLLPHTHTHTDTHTQRILSCSTPISPYRNSPLHTLTLALTGTGPGTHGLSSTIFHLLISPVYAPTAPTPSLMPFTRAPHVPPSCTARVAHSKWLSG